MPGTYVVELDISGRCVLIVGGGAVAERKVERLLTCGAEITLVSPEATAALSRLAEAGRLTWEQRCFAAADLDGRLLVIAATDSREINAEIAHLCRDRNILVNAVNRPDLCSFNVPAQVRQGDLTISVSTNGRSPALARHIREQLETQFGTEYAELLEMLEELRPVMQARFTDEAERRRRWRTMVTSDVLQLLKERRKAEAERVLQSCMS